MSPHAAPASRPSDDWFPWPPRPGSSPLEAFFQTWKLSVFQPTRFFQGLPAPRPLGPAVLYFLIIGIAAVGISLFWLTLFEATLAATGLRAEADGPVLGPWMPVVQFLLSPLFLLLGLGISFVVHHAILALVGGARRGPGTTLRVLSFAYGPALFAVVPLLGPVVGGFWMLALAIIGLREAHQTESWRAATAILLPLVLLILLSIAAAVIIGVLAANLTV
jgi:hypothetical protein